MSPTNPRFFPCAGNDNYFQILPELIQTAFGSHNVFGLHRLLRMDMDKVPVITKLVSRGYSQTHRLQPTQLTLSTRKCMYAEGEGVSTFAPPPSPKHENSMACVRRRVLSNAGRKTSHPWISEEVSEAYHEARNR
jgi:hypothetical protein